MKNRAAEKGCSVLIFIFQLLFRRKFGTKASNAGIAAQKFSALPFFTVQISRVVGGIVCSLFLCEMLAKSPKADFASIFAGVDEKLY